MTAQGSGYAAGLVVACVLLFAAWAKVRNHAQVVTEFERMGIRSPRFVAGTIPIMEVVIAGLLIVFGWTGAMGALALFSAFTVVLLRIIASGSAASCACFGAVSERPVDWLQVVRNGCLIVAGCWALLGSRSAPTVIDVVVVASATIVVVGLLRLLRHNATVE